MATDEECKKLSELRVIDLRMELEKRGLPKTGSKVTLMERLQKALISEGKDLDQYKFELHNKNCVHTTSTGSQLKNETVTQCNSSTRATEASTTLERTPKREKAVEETPDNEESVAETSRNLTFLEESLESDRTFRGSSRNEVSIEEPAKTPVTVKRSPVKAVSMEGRHEGSPVRIEERLEYEAELEDSLLDGVPLEYFPRYKIKEEQIENTGVESLLNLSFGEEDVFLNIDFEHNYAEDVVKNEVCVETTDAKEFVSTSQNTDHHEEAEEERKKVENEQKDRKEVSEETEKTTSLEDTSKSDASAPIKEESQEELKKTTKSNVGRSLWVTNLLPETRARELKQLLSPYGKVIGAKVVQNSRYPGQKCYGYITMETRAAADLCMKKLHNTELKGQIIRVTKVRPEQNLPLKTVKKEPVGEKPSSTSDIKNIKKEKVDSKEDVKPRRRSDNKSSRSPSKSSRYHRGRSQEGDILTFDKIQEERERQRRREREREEEKRRREIEHARVIEKRQREEAARLERERERLRLERERLDRQRTELMRLERERQKMEREKLEQEKQELRRQQVRLEESRRSIKRSSTSLQQDSSQHSDDRKRYDEPPSSSTNKEEPLKEYGNKTRQSYSKNEDFQKRPTPKRHYEEILPSRFEAPCRGKPDMEDYSKKPYKPFSKNEEYRGDHQKRNQYLKRDYIPIDHRPDSQPNHEIQTMGSSISKYPSPFLNHQEKNLRERERVAQGRDSKEGRFSASMDEKTRRPIPVQLTRGKRSSRDLRCVPSMGRYKEEKPWQQSGAPPVKQFSGMGVSSRDSWSRSSDNWKSMGGDSNERWGGSSRIEISPCSGVPRMYGNVAGGDMLCPPPPGTGGYMERFDGYKPINSSRKY